MPSRDADALAAVTGPAAAPPRRRRRRRLRLAAALGLALATALPASHLSPPPRDPAYITASPADPQDREQLVSALHALPEQRPGISDLYVIGFAGDAGEDVFRNETRYLQRLFAQRFGAAGRIVTLVNHPDNHGRHRYAAHASYDNLYATLAAVGRRIDRDEDVLLLFLTSHGAEDSSLYVQVDASDEDWITPEELRHALDDAGIRHRVIVLSACYAGGFIPALKTPDTMIITAARADRASFGCGGGSDLTYFGHAWLVEGLNQSSDFEQAFWQATRAIDARERADGQTPSLPQLWRGGRIGATLARWQATLQPGPPLPYPAPASKD